MSIFAASLLLLAHTQAAPFTVKVAKVVPDLRPIALAAAPSGNRFAACMEDGSVRIIDSVTRQTVRTLEKHPQAAYAVAWSPDGLLIATGDETARVWISSAVSGKKIREYRVHQRGIQKLSFNSANNLLISTGKDDVVMVYNLTSKSAKEERQILGKGINFYGGTFSPTLPTTFAVATLGPGPRVYNAKNGSVTGFMTGHDGQGSFDIEFNRNGTRAVSAGRDGTAVVWDTKTNQRLASLKGHQDWVLDADFTPNGKFIATSSTDKTVKIWNIYNYQKVQELTDQSFVGSPLCFTADGKTLVTVSDQGYLQYNTVNPPQPAVVAKPAAKPRR